MYATDQCAVPSDNIIKLCWTGWCMQQNSVLSLVVRS